MNSEDAAAIATRQFAGVCAGAECGGSTFWEGRRESDILRALQPSSHDTESDLLSVHGDGTDGCECSCSPDMPAPAGPEGPPGPPDEDSPPFAPGWYWWWWWRYVHSLEEAQGKKSEEELEEEAKKREEEAARRKKEAAEREKWRKQAEKDRLKAGWKKGSWSVAMSGTLHGSFGVMPEGFSLSSNARFAGTPGFGIAATGSLVGQSLSTFVGGPGFGLAPPGTTLGSSLPAFLGGGGFGVFGATQFGQVAQVAPPRKKKKKGTSLAELEEGEGKKQVLTATCGPKIDEWLAVELDVFQRWVSEFHKEIERWKMPDVLGGFRAETEFWTLKQVAPQLQYKSRTDFSNIPCGTGRCRKTVTLAGVCIDRSEIGNIVFGAIARWLNTSLQVTLLGAQWANLMIANDDFSVADTAAIKLGWNFANQGIPNSKISQYIRSPKLSGYRTLMTRDAPQAPPCAPCNQNLRSPHLFHSTIYPGIGQLHKLHPKLGSNKLKVSVAVPWLVK